MSMEQRLKLAGTSGVFTSVLRRTLEDCGFKADIVEGEIPESRKSQDVFIYEVRNKADLSGIPKRNPPKPYLIFSETGLDKEEADALKESGLVGVITGATTPEVITFLANSAIFYSKVLRRNPRVPVSIQVDIRAGSRVIKTTSSLLSRDGMFVVTLNPLPSDTVCDLEFDSPATGKRLSMKARVLYSISVNKDLSIISSPADPFKRIVTHPGMALFFIDLPDEERKLIDGYIEAVK